MIFYLIYKTHGDNMQEQNITKKPNIKAFFKELFSYISSHPALMIAVLAYGIAFANEAFSRRSVWETVVFVFTKPFMFICNMAIIAVFEALAMLSKKRVFWLWTVSLFWLAMGLTNFIMMFSRITPFSSMDFVLLRSVFPILPYYLTWVGVIVCIVAVLAAVIGLVILYFKARKVKVNYTRSAVTLLVTAVLSFAFIGTGILTGAIPDHFSSLPKAYKDHGFTLCFSISIFDRGVSKPDGYDENIDGIVSDVKGDDDREQPENTPNIIFVQLESFYDPKLLKGFSFSEDPTPIFSVLRENCTSGILTVPSIGAGTANTEFEIITGMSMKYFGAGEYPYQTFLQSKTCESLPYILKYYGYKSHAVHNFKATFYERNLAYSMLGFDTFTAIEYMNGIEENILGWAKDDVLVPYVMKSLSSTEGPDFVQCVTVQGHGQYPTSDYEGEEKEKIKVTSLPEGANKHSYTYYVNQLYQTDRFIGELISAVEDLGEDTVIVFYGDHIPNIGFEEEWVPDGMTLFDTEYIIWRSNGKSTEGKDICAYQLYSDVLSMLNIEGGMMSKLHERRDQLDPAKYSYYLHSLQYDIVEQRGKDSYKGELPFKQTDLKLGIDDIRIETVYYSSDRIYIQGTGFTEASRIFVNGVQKETEFVDDKTLILSGVNLKNGDKIKVVQITNLVFHVSSTENFIYKEQD